MEFDTSDLLGSLRALGANAEECWKGLLAAGISAHESLVAVNRSFKDPFQTLKSVMEILEAHDPKTGFEQLAWLPDALEACGIHPLSIRLYSHSMKCPTPHLKTREWLRTPVWNRPDPHWQDAMVVPKHPVFRDTFSQMLIPTTPDLALVFQEPVHLEDCYFGAVLPPIFAKGISISRGHGLRQIPFLGTPLGPSRDWADRWIRLEHLHELEDLPQDLSIIEADLLIKDCPKVRLPERMKVRSLELTDLDHLDALPLDLHIENMLVVERCSFLMLPSSKRSTVHDDAENSNSHELTLQTLTLKNLPELTDMHIQMQSYGDLWIQYCANLEFIREFPPCMGDIHIYDCPKLSALPVIPTRPISINTMRLARLPLLQRLPSKLDSSLLILEDLASLTSLPEDMSVGDLEIKDCPNLRCLPEGMRIRSDLSLEDLPNLDQWPVGFECSSFTIKNCPKLLLLPCPDGWSIREDGLHSWIAERQP